MIGRRHYIFTKKKHSTKAIMSTILGVISIASFILVIYFAYRRGGEAAFSYGVSGFLITVFSFVGLLLGVWSRTERDIFYFFTYFGIILNLLVLVGISLLLQAPNQWM